MDMNNITFKQYVDMTEINDSMLLSSGTVVAELEVSGLTAEIRAVGLVRVRFDGSVYKDFSQFPKELVQIIKDGKLYEDSRVEVDFNNWFEMFYFQNGKEVCDSDLVDIEGYGCDRLLRFMLQMCLATERENKAREEAV